jgi:hypothetical protein
MPHKWQLAARIKAMYWLGIFVPNFSNKKAAEAALRRFLSPYSRVAAFFGVIIFLGVVMFFEPREAGAGG